MESDKVLMVHILWLCVFSQSSVWKNKPLTIRGWKSKRDFTHVFDIANANYLAMNSNKVGRGEVINIGNSDNRFVNDIAEMMGGPKVFINPVIEPRGDSGR